MASFSEPQYPIPASESHDFVLYSTHDSYPDFMPTSNIYTSTPYLNTTGAAFDPFSLPSFPTTQSHEFGFGAPSGPSNVKGSFHPHTPAESPTNSAHNSFDIQPPNLSSTSDSGTSVQSTSSSAMGSPSLNPTYAQESWSTLSQGLGIAPGIVQHDHLGHEPFGTSSYDYDSLLVDDKVPGCVGESSSISSTQRLPPPASSFSSSQNQSQYYSNVFRTGQRPFDPQRATSLDTSMAGHRSPSSASSLQTPTSANPYSGKGQQSGLQRTQSSDYLAAPGSSEFKSPITPASATRSRPFSPPSGDRRGRVLSNSNSRENRTRSMTTPITGLTHGIGTSAGSQGASPSHAAQSPFFSQTSGLFVAPLGSSCWFPYPCRFRIFLFCFLFLLFSYRNDNFQGLRLTFLRDRSIPHSTLHPSSVCTHALCRLLIYVASDQL